MSAVYGVNKTLINAGGVNPLSKGKYGGMVQSMDDIYEAVALEAASTITMCGRLPKGARILEVLLAYDAMGGAVTMSVGDAESAARYLSAIDVSSAGVTRSNLVDGIAYETDETVAATVDTQLIITTAGAAATGTVKLVVFYLNQ